MTDDRAANRRQSVVDNCTQQGRLVVAGENPDDDAILVRGFVDRLMEVKNSDDT